MQVNFEKNIDAGFFGGSAFKTLTPTYACFLTINDKTKEREATMSSFGEIASKFNKLGENKKIQNGLYLQTLMLFHAMCHLKSDELSVENANKKHGELYGQFLNSASLSRNNAILVKLGLIKLHESQTDRRMKSIMFTISGTKFKSMFKDIPKYAKEVM